MVDEDLAADIERFCRQMAPRVRILSKEETSALVNRIGERHRLGLARNWWWDGIVGANVVSYNDCGLSTLARLIPAASAPLYLVITDDESPPWMAVAGLWGDICHLLEENRYFESFVVNDACTWVVFDTHHNQLIALGDFG
jgi:hypothetical protein